MKGKIPKIVKFMHYRAIDEHGKPYSQGGATVAYIDEDGSPIRFSVASCHYRDNFNKKIGRAISSGRLLSSSDRAEVFTEGGFAEFEKYMNEFMSTVYDYERRRKPRK